MRKTVRAILLLAFVAGLVLSLYFFVRRVSAGAAAALPIAGRSLDISTDLASAGPARSQAAGAARARVNAEYGELFLDAFDVNLDEDEDLEQVIVSKPSAEGGGRLSVVVADFFPLAGVYRRIWKGETLAVKPKAFVIQPRDLLGDGRVELLCFGIDAANRQTLTVFRRSRSAGSPFSTIFSASGLSILVQYQEGQPGVPALIQVFEAAGSGGSPLDQVRRDYSWSAQAGAYRPGQSFQIPGEKVERDYIDRVLTGSAADFETYLDGLWVKEGGKDGKEVLISFQSSAREIVLRANPDVQIWDWGESSPSSAGLTCPVSNGAVPDMLRLLSVELIGVDRIRLGAYARQIDRFAPREDWDGSYRRFKEGPGAGEARGFKAAAELHPLARLPLPGGALNFDAADLEGSWAGQGFSLRLEDGLFETVERKSQGRGRYYLFRWGDYLVLDLLPYEESVSTEGRRSFIVLPRPGKEGRIEGLKLRQAQVEADSIRPLYRPDIGLERLEPQGAK